MEVISSKVAAVTKHEFSSHLKEILLLVFDGFFSKYIPNESIMLILA